MTDHLEQTAGVDPVAWSEATTEIRQMVACLCRALADLHQCERTLAALLEEEKK